jgi:hypothetical protein
MADPDRRKTLLVSYENAATIVAALGRGQIPLPGDEPPYVEMSGAPSLLGRAAEEAAQA